MLQKIPKSLTIYLMFNIIIHLWILSLNESAAWNFILQYGVTPSLFIANFSKIQGKLTILSHAFLHFDTMHLCLNCLWALVFGTIMARNVSFTQFWGFVTLVTIFSSLGYIALNVHSTNPMLGASGVVSGFMGAALHCFPSMYESSGRFHVSSAPVQLPQGYFNAIRTVFHFKPAVNMFLMVHALNVIAAISPALLGSSAPIAWEVHIIGFWAGIFLAPLFFRKKTNNQRNYSQF